MIENIKIAFNIIKLTLKVWATTLLIIIPAAVTWVFFDLYVLHDSYTRTQCNGVSCPLEIDTN